MMLLRLIDRLLGVEARDPADRTTDIEIPEYDEIVSTRIVPWDTRVESHRRACGYPTDPSSPWVAPTHPDRPDLAVAHVVVTPLGDPRRGLCSKDGPYLAWAEAEVVVTYRRPSVALAA